MRGLLLIGTLIALAVIAYLQLTSTNSALESDRETAANKMEQVEQDVVEAMEVNMEKLQQMERKIE